MEVDSPDDENHSPCYQRLKLKVEVNAPIKNKNSHINKKAKTDKNVNKTPDNDKNKTTKIDNTNVKKKFKKRKIKKDSVEDFVFPTKTARPASPSNSEQIAIANNFSDLTVDQNQVIEEKEAKIADIPNPRPLQPIHLKITKNFRKTKLNLSIKNSLKQLTKRQVNSLNSFQRCGRKT
ncbi:hypothetical protein TNCV_2574981 [Trichonephila clavipes]|nr:hypothetical protein TNCV_2574981 [Trichonephila clavipes]